MAEKIEVEPEVIFKKRVDDKQALKQLVVTFSGMSLPDLEDWINDNFTSLPTKERAALLKMLKVLWALLKTVMKIM